MQEHSLHSSPASGFDLANLIFATKLGIDDPAIHHVKESTGSLLRYHGKLEESKCAFRQALDGTERTLGEDNPVALQLATNLGFVLQEKGEIKEATTFLMRGIEGYHRIKGSGLYVASSWISSLAQLSRDQGNWEEAEYFYAQLLQPRIDLPEKRKSRRG